MTKVCPRVTLVSVALLSLLAGDVVTLSAQERGKRVYREACARCHGSTFQGGVHAPTLTGTSFTSVWGSRSDDELFEYIRLEMPPGQGGTLRDAEVREIVALIRLGDAAWPPVVAEDGLVSIPGGRTTRFGDREATGLAPVTDSMLQHPPAGDWLTWRRTLDGQGYSPLTQITTENVDELQLAWVLSMRDGVNETTPIVHDGVMFLASPGNVVHAIDAASGELIWEYRYEVPPDAKTAIGATRGLALYGDKVFIATLDAAIVAHRRIFNAGQQCVCQRVAQLQLTRATVLDALGRSQEAKHARESAAAARTAHGPSRAGRLHDRLEAMNKEGSAARE